MLHKIVRHFLILFFILSMIQKNYLFLFAILYLDGKMVEIVKSDKSGRIVIPKSLRNELHMKNKTMFILTKKGKGTLLLQKIDVEEMAKNLEKELAGKDLDAIVASIRKEIDEKTKARYPDLSG